MVKVVLKVDLYDDRIKQKAMMTVSGILGVESVSVDMKDDKLTLTGDIDPVCVVRKLRKWCHTKIVSVDSAKEEKKKEESKNKADKDSAKAPEPVKLYEACPLCCQMRPAPLQCIHHCHYVTYWEEDPYYGCVIC